MPPSADAWLDRVASLRVYRRGERRAPHKALLLLLALGALQRGHRTLAYADMSGPLSRLLDRFAPPVSAAVEPQRPWWHLRSDGLWVVEGAADAPLNANGFPRAAWLAGSHGTLAPELADLVESDLAFAGRVVRTLLDGHFPGTLHGLLLDLTGAPEPGAPGTGRATPAGSSRASSDRVPDRPRDAAFRRSVLGAYNHRCAVTGFAATLDGLPVACEAAHLHWHAFDGPDRTDNGLCLEPTVHRLLDLGAWTVSDDGRVLVSARFDGGSEALRRLRERHGQPLRLPTDPVDAPAPAFARWHREPARGGVFRLPAIG